MNTDRAGPPRRKLEECRLTHGGRFLVVGVDRAVGPRMRRLTATYAVEVREGAVDLVTEKGEVYTVTRYGCTCPDSQFNAVVCKHRCACAELGLVGESVAESEEVA